MHGDDKSFDPAPWLEFPKLVLWGANHYASRLPDSSAWICWDKRAASGHTNDFADCEFAWTNLGGPARMFRHHWDGMMRDSERGEERIHPTQKPVALMGWCIERAGVPPGGLVFDPFTGSGSTALACFRTGRRFLGCEIDERYFRAAVERLRNEMRQLELPF